MITLLEVIAELEKRNIGEPKVYFSGEYESNQTKFEYLSNNLLIGVEANNKGVGIVMLRILRYITDNYLELYNIDSNPEENAQFLQEYVDLDEHSELDRIILAMYESEKTYMQSFKKDEEFKVKLMKDKNGICTTYLVKNKYGTTNIYGMNRLKNELIYLMNNPSEENNRIHYKPKENEINHNQEIVCVHDFNTFFLFQRKKYI
jgi:hypothetical protein